MKKTLLLSIFLATLAFAQQSNYKYEVTPMIAGTYTEGNMNLDRNYANAGVSLGFNLDESMFDQIELGFLNTLEDVDYKNSTQNTQISRIFTNVIKEYPLGDKTALYALVGAGVEIYGSEAFKNETGLFANYGVGYKYTFDNAMALKVDLRHLIEDDHGDNNLLYTVGLAIPFGEKSSHAPQEKKAVQDDDNDGVPNNVDECLQSAPKAIVDTKGCVVTVDLHINFATNKSVIKDQYDSKLASFAQILKNDPSIQAILSAHTDSVGPKAYNQNLSEQRAKAVKQALVNMGIDASRITANGYGETKPLASNKTALGRAENRRVEATMSK